MKANMYVLCKEVEGDIQQANNVPLHHMNSDPLTSGWCSAVGSKSCTSESIVPATSTPPRMVRPWTRGRHVHSLKRTCFWLCVHLNSLGHRQSWFM